MDSKLHANAHAGCLQGLCGQSSASFSHLSRRAERGRIKTALGRNESDIFLCGTPLAPVTRERLS
jgi:hypothetical protein